MNHEVKIKTSAFVIFCWVFANVLLVASCRTPRYITEKYIKTNIEDHKEGEFSRIETYSIFQKVLSRQSGSPNGLAYIECTGYKHNGKTGMVIGAFKFQSKRVNLSDKNMSNLIVYINLNSQQCKSILSNYKELETKIATEKPRLNEAIYHDFSVSRDIFISYEAIPGKPKTAFINFWIKGEKYTIPNGLFIRKFQQFMKYYASE